MEADIPIQIADKTFRPHIHYAQLASAVRREAKRIRLAYAFSPEPVVLATVLTGAYRFMAELVPHLWFPYEVTFLRASSYGAGMESNGNPQISWEPALDVQGKRVLVLEDIVETGATVEAARELLLDAGAAEVQVAALLFKPKAFKRVNPAATWRPNFACVEIGDVFVVGFGLDYAECGRWLEGIYILDTEA